LTNFVLEQDGDDEEDDDADKNGFNDDVWKSFKRTVYANNPEGFSYYLGNTKNDPQSTHEVCYQFEFYLLFCLLFANLLIRIH